MDIENIRSNLDEEAIILDDLDDCILGYSTDGILIYSYDRMIQYFCDHGMDEFDAIEWVNFNILGLTNNGAGFIVCIENQNM